MIGSAYLCTEMYKRLRKRSRILFDMVQKKKAAPAKAAAKAAKPAYDPYPSSPPPPKRGRPRQYDPKEALERARDVFWVKGYAATSLDDIVEATGMNRPSLYAAFGDKHGIYLAALRMMAERLEGAIAGAVALDLSLKAFLDFFFERCLDSYLSGADGPRGCFLVGTAVTEAVADGDVREMVRECFEACEEHLAERFAKAKAAGELPAGADPKALALLTSSTMHDLAMFARTGAGRPALEARVKLARKLIGV